MKPFEYLRQYRDLTVQLVSGRLVPGIDVHEYRNAQDVFDKRNTDDDASNNVDGMSADFDAGPGWTVAWSALRAKIVRHGKKQGGGLYSLQFPLPTKDQPTPAAGPPEIVNAPALAQAYIGKGTPEIIASALRYAEAFGLVAGNASAMQKYCDEYIGLDCNGYVGNYLKAEGSKLVGPSTSANAGSFMPESRRLSKLADVKYRSVLCWKSAGHVAIIDTLFGPVLAPPKFDTEVVRCMVCESTGARLVPGDIHTDGLNYTLYEIHPPTSSKVFKVKRGLGGNKLNDVYIGDLV
jgi:hypothetical protein